MRTKITPMLQSSLRPALCAAIAIVASLLATGAANAAPNSFLGTDGTMPASWNVNDNWSLGTTPVSTDTVVEDSSTATLTQTLDNSFSITGLQVTDPTGAITINSGSGSNTLTLGAGGIDMSAATQNLTLNPNIVIGADQTWTVASGLTLNGIAGSGTSSGSGTGNINMVNATGSGTATILFNQNGNASGSQTGWANYSGNITVNSGVAVVSQGHGAAAFGTGTIILNGGSIAQTSGSWDWSNDINVEADSTIATNSSNGLGRGFKLGGNLTSSNSSALTFTNTTTGGDRYTTSGIILAGTAPSTYGATIVSANTQVRIGGNSSTASFDTAAGPDGSLGTGTVTLLATSSRLSFTRTNAISVSNDITGLGSIVISPNGTDTQIVTFSGTNSYTGTTDVQVGTLLVNGNQSAATGAVTVSNSGTLGGIGTLGGATTVSAGNITGGTDGTIGALTTGALTLNSGATYKFDLNSTTNTTDLLNSTGALTLGGTLAINDLNAGTPTSNLIIAQGTSLTGQFSGLAQGASVDGGLYTIDYGNLNANAVTLAVPEPSTYALMAIFGVGMLFLFRRRRTA